MKYKPTILIEPEMVQDAVHYEQNDFVNRLGYNEETRRLMKRSGRVSLLAFKKLAEEYGKTVSLNGSLSSYLKDNIGNILSIRGTPRSDSRYILIPRSLFGLGKVNFYVGVSLKLENNRITAEIQGYIPSKSEKWSIVDFGRGKCFAAKYSNMDSIDNLLKDIGSRLEGVDIEWSI